MVNLESETTRSFCAVEKHEFRPDVQAALLINQKTILDILASNQITRVIIGFTEEDYVIGFDFTVAHAGTAKRSLPDIAIAYALPDLSRKTMNIPSALTDMIDILLGSDRDCEAGAEGTLCIDLEKKVFIVSGLRREVVEHPYRRILQAPCARS